MSLKDNNIKFGILKDYESLKLFIWTLSLFFVFNTETTMFQKEVLFSSSGGEGMQLLI
jgi:hypothetical protein